MVHRAHKVIKRLARRAPGSKALHEKKRRLEHLCRRLDLLTRDLSEGRVRICFGGRRLFRRQFHLEDNGYRDHEQWLEEWRRARANQFFVVGSSDETGGNQSCVATVAEDGTLRLRLRLPPALAHEYGKYLEIGGIRFRHGHQQIIAALESITIKTTTSCGRRVTKRIGRAISYRFLRDEKSWRLFVTVDEDLPPTATWRELGAIGVDVNVDHLAVVETDGDGNLVEWWLIPLRLRGKTSGERRAVIMQACARVAELARERGLPVVIEQLDFARKRAELEGVGADRARELSSFSYSQILDCIDRACCRRGVEVIRRSAAYTSVIGAVNYATRYGVSVHVGAACAVARRGLGFAERPVGSEARVPTRGGRHVTLLLPARNRGEHVWRFWACVLRALRAVHGAHTECDRRSPPSGQIVDPPGACRLGVSGETPGRESSAEPFG
ncbi:MAG: transposase [Pyrinomonas methylaliphatogenes]|nr:transposase [Pyrinomonas methylaliphatogenes]